jgi:hypothetical protein
MRADVHHMRKLLLICLFVLVALPARAQAPLAFSCGEDSHVDAAKKQAVDSAAMAFAALLIGTDPGAAFDSFSKVGQQSTTRDGLAASVGPFLRQFPPTNLAVQHTYFINLGGKSPGRAVCGADVSKPDGWESLAAADVPEQAHVAISADVPNGHIAINVWVVPEANAWKVQSFWLNFSTLGEQDSVQLWTLATAQRARGHNFNASLLYTAATQTSNRGPNFQMGIAQTISKDASNFTPPDQVKGQPPFLWQSGPTTFKVLSVGPIAIAGKIYVIVVHEVAPWSADAQADAQNKLVIAYLEKTFPEISEVFAGLVVRAVERGGNRIYGTVEEFPAPK